VRRRLDVWIALGLLIVGWGIRLALAMRLAFPPLDDPAFYLQTARHLATGRGLVSDVLWSYQFPFPGVTHPSHEYWMPMATILMAPWIKAFGDSLHVAQIPGTLCGALLVPLTYVLGRVVQPDDRRIALGASLLLLAGALPVYQAASTDSAAPFAVLGAGALLAGGLGVERRSAWLCLIAGLLGGLAYLARSDGILIPALIGAFILVNLRLSWRAAVLLALLGAGSAVPMGAWWVRNLHAFGVLQPIPPSIAAALQDYAQMFNWNAPPTLASLFARGIEFVVGLRLQALWHNLGVWVLIAFPYGVFGWLGLLRTRRVVMTLGLAYAVLLMLSSALVFSVPTLAGLFYHSAGAMLPWLAVGAALVIVRIARWRRSPALGLCVATAMLILVQSALAWPRVIVDSINRAGTFKEATAWLADNADPAEPVLATQAHSLNYASGQPAMSLPVGQDFASVMAVAERYGARYILVTESMGRYPAALDEQVGSGVELVHRTSRLLVYEIEPAK
jgi:4-amino-4-deoxy-L-arabinose transferase-like glycosyltransferase